MKKYSAPRIYHPQNAVWFLTLAIKYWHLYTPEETDQIQQGIDILSKWLQPTSRIKNFG